MQFFTYFMQDFLPKALRDNKLFDIDEPFQKLLTQGMVQSAAYKNQ